MPVNIPSGDGVHNREALWGNGKADALEIAGVARVGHLRLDGGLLLPVVDLLKVQFTEPLVLLDVIRAALRVIVHADV